MQCNNMFLNAVVRDAEAAVGICVWRGYIVVADFILIVEKTNTKYKQRKIIGVSCLVV